jgi:hypothetical protein
MYFSELEFGCKGAIRSLPKWQMSKNNFVVEESKQLVSSSDATEFIYIYEVNKECLCDHFRL